MERKPHIVTTTELETVNPQHLQIGAGSTRSHYPDRPIAVLQRVAAQAEIPIVKPGDIFNPDGTRQNAE